MDEVTALGRGAARSRLWRSPAWPPGGPEYVNAAMKLHVEGAPEDLLVALHAIEARWGRERGVRWGARTLDLDLLAWGGLVRPDDATQSAWRALPPDRQGEEAPDRLILPHPRMQDRGFVLIPLLDVAPDWRHPLIGASVREMVAALAPGMREGGGAPGRLGGPCRLSTARGDVTSGASDAGPPDPSARPAAAIPRSCPWPA
jgi:2-amino-4-hydroxy-6-hydroxymethyldihydropteridine diphosphokinase